MNFEQRLDCLEKQNANLRRGLLGLLLLVVVVPLAAFVWQDKKPRVGRFELVDTHHLKVTGAIFVGGAHGPITERDHRGPHITLAIYKEDPEKPSIIVSKGGGSEVFSALAPGDLCLFSKKTGNIYLVAHDFAGSTLLKPPFLSINDSTNHPRAVLGRCAIQDPITKAITYHPESTLTLFNDKGKVIHRVPR